MKKIISILENFEYLIRLGIAAILVFPAKLLWKNNQVFVERFWCWLLKEDYETIMEDRQNEWDEIMAELLFKNGYNIIDGEHSRIV